MEWLPIETAPRDGTWILLYLPIANGWHARRRMIREAKWFDGRWSGSAGNYFRPDEAKHWMPLPTPPRD